MTPPPDAATTSSLGPPQVPAFAILMRALGGVGGGLVGTALILVISLLASSVLQSALGAQASEDGVHPLFVFVFLAMIFLSSATANLLGPLFIGLSEREKYRHLSTTLYQIFIANVVILILVAPLYVLMAGLNLKMVAAVAALHIVLSTFSSALILEIIADYRYALLGVYSTVLAVLVSSGISFLFYSLFKANPSFLLFPILPLLWFSIGFFNGLLGFLYGWIYKLYGTDFLSSAITYGADQEWISEKEEAQLEMEAEAKADARKNDEGAAFLNKTVK